MLQRYKIKTIFAAALFAASSAIAAQATTLKITVTNNQAVGGLSITPLYTALHNGAFDAFDNMGTASAGLELIAETGNPSAIATERLAVDSNSVGLFLPSPSGPPPVQPGETVSGTFNVTPTSSLYFTFLSMLLPSNDHFIGNDDPLAYQIFDAAGQYTGDRVIQVTGAHIYDAGTEANGLTGAAFVQGQDIMISLPGESTIEQGIPLPSEFAGQVLATGATLDGSLIDFTSSPTNFDLLTIEISEVAPVPLPAGAPLLLGALGILGWHKRRQMRS